MVSAGTQSDRQPHGASLPDQAQSSVGHLQGSAFHRPGVHGTIPLSKLHRLHIHVGRRYHMQSDPSLIVHVLI